MPHHPYYKVSHPNKAAGECKISLSNLPTLPRPSCFLKLFLFLFQDSGDELRLGRMFQVSSISVFVWLSDGFFAESPLSLSLSLPSLSLPPSLSFTLVDKPWAEFNFVNLLEGYNIERTEREGKASIRAGFEPTAANFQTAGAVLQENLTFYGRPNYVRLKTSARKAQY